MGSIRRISNNLMALVAGVGISAGQQLLYTPLFLYIYGKTGYGQWLALSAAVSYLGTLNFGVQTYVNQDLTLKFQRGETEEFKVQQSTALRLLLGIMAGGAMLSLLVFVLPLSELLRLTISQREASVAAYFLSLQVLIGFVYGYIGGNYMVVGRSHRGANWSNVQRILLIGVTCMGAWMRFSFASLAIVQFGSIVISLAALLVDVRMTAPEIFPSLRYWNGEAVPTMLKQSGYFGLITSSTFLAYSVPVMLIQRIAGPEQVVVFNVMRFFFQLSRQLLSTMTQSMGPEITRLFGMGDWPGLLKLYNLSERFIFFCIPVVNLGVLSLSPIMLVLWLHKSVGIFSLPLYAVGSAVGFVMCAKEHKYFFQFSTNMHQELAKIMFFSYAAMAPISMVTIHFFGTLGFLLTWLAVEIYQMLFILRLNFNLFASYERVEVNYVIRLGAIGAAGIAGIAAMMHATEGQGLAVRIGSAVLAVGAIAAVSYRVFDMPEVTKRFAPRVLEKFGMARG